MTDNGYGLINKLVDLIEDKNATYIKWKNDPINNSDEYFKILNLYEDMNILGRHILPTFRGFPNKGYD